jgi:hypothetical protein
MHFVFLHTAQARTCILFFCTGEEAGSEDPAASKGPKAEQEEEEEDAAERKNCSCDAVL